MLYQHQSEAGRWLSERSRAYLADVPGLGKTLSLLEGLARSNAVSTLVVCPAIVRTHWAREAAFYRSMFGDVGPMLTIKSYDEITRGGFELMAELLANDVDSMVLDEVHYCKHANAQRTQFLLGPNGYARRVEIVWGASGTPVSKNPYEYWTTLSTLFPEIALKHGLRTHEDFKARFCVVKPRYLRGKTVEKIMPELRNEAEFREILEETMLRRTLDDVGLDVPELDFQIVRLDKTDGATLPWDLLREEICPGGVRAAIDAGTLADIANDPFVARMRRRLGELKVAPVAEMLQSQLADSDEKIVVFAHHTNVLESLRTLLSSFGVAFVDGDVRNTARDEAIDRFQSDPRCRVFLGQNIACQTGITLTAAKRVVLVEPDWTGDVNFQLGKRVARIGQTSKRVIVQMITLAGTLDEGIVRQNQRETEMAAQALQ
jgi:SWI/SNF-related matrix-associated actin-dependent regulator 1 of chromatin subfamily A